MLNSQVIGTTQLETLWKNHGGDSASIEKEQFKPLLREITKQMDVTASETDLDEWIEACRSSQSKYATDKINFLHFKRLFLSVTANSKTRISLTHSMEILKPTRGNVRKSQKLKNN